MIKQTFRNIKTNISFDKGIWTLESLPESYVQMSEEQYIDNRKKKMTSNLGQQLTEWELPDLSDESKVNFSSFKGNVTLFDFWFKGCAPCLSAIPRLNVLTKKYSANDFKIYGIEFNEMHDRNTLLKYIKTNQVEYPNLYKGKALALNYGITSGPTFMIVNKEGKIIHIESGYSIEHMDKIEDLIKSNI